MLGLLEPALPLLASGWLGVDLFFVLSGFVLAHNYVTVLGRRPSPRSAARFYWARLSRVWPTWMIVLAGSIAGSLVQQQIVGSEPIAADLDATTLLRQVILVQVWDRPHYAATGPVGPGWSLSAEWLAYLFFPAVVLALYRLRGCRAPVLGALALAAVTPFAYLCLTLGTHDWRWSWLLRLAGCFLAGALVALCVRRVRPRPAVARNAAHVAAGAVLLVLLAVWAAGEARGGVAVLCFPVLVGALALADGGLARWLSGPAVVLGGRISFALYLVHMGVFEAAWTVQHVLPVGGAVGTLLYLAVAGLPLPVAWTLWRFVEEPARRRMRAIETRVTVLARTGRRAVDRSATDAPVPVNG